MDIITILCNLLPLFLVVYYMVDGWGKGGLYMVVSLIRLFASYFIARVASNYVAQAIMQQPELRAQLTSFALSQHEKLTQLPGMMMLLTGHSIESTVEAVAWWVVYALSFLVCFVVLMLIFALVLKLSLASNHIPVLGFVNRLLGLLGGTVFGVLFTLLVIYLVAFGLNLFGHQDISQVLLASWLPVLFRTLV